MFAAHVPVNRSVTVAYQKEYKNPKMDLIRTHMN